MKLNVCTKSDCSILISEVEGEYLVSDSIAKNKFKYSDTISIDLLQLNKTTGTEIQQPIFNLRTQEVHPVKLHAKFDGWFTIVHIVIPSIEWFNREVEKDQAINLYDIVYYSDGTSIYKYVDGSSQIVSVEEVINRNPENTTITIVKKDYVSVCFLRKCYINLCQQLFNQKIASKCNIDNQSAFNRDLVWMALNVISYLVELNQLAEAQIIIELINNGCNGICKQNVAIPRGCNCS